MDKKLLSIYQFPLAISLTLAIILIALGTVREPFVIASIIVGTLLGTFILDSEYLINAYFLEPEKDFSKTLVAFVKHADIPNALKHIYYHKDEARDLSLNSALFQIVLAFLTIFVIYSTKSIFAKAFVLSVFANSIYVLIEYYFKKRTDEWFWTFKVKPTEQQALLFILGMLAVFAFSLYIY